MFRRNSMRRKQFVSGRIQGRLMLQIVLYWGLYHLFLWHAMFLYGYADLRLSAVSSHTATSIREYYGHFSQEYFPVVICALATLPIVVLDMMKLTHRIAGPMIRFQDTLRDLTAGKTVKPIKLRKGDLMTEFQDEFNRYLAHLAAQRPAAHASGHEDDVAREIGDLCRSVREAATGAAHDRASAPSRSH